MEHTDGFDELSDEFWKVLIVRQARAQAANHKSSFVTDGLVIDCLGWRLPHNSASWLASRKWTGRFRNLRCQQQHKGSLEA